MRRSPTRMFGHADETDDFEPVTKAHPGCAVVPAAFAVGEREGRSGTEVLRAVVLGYDLCCRFLMALGPDHVRGDASQRRRHELHVRRGGRGRLAGAARRARDALRALVCRAAGIGHLELDARYRTHREGVRLRRHGRAQRRQRGADGAERIHRRRRRARRRAQHDRGALHRAEAGRDGGGPRAPLLRHRDRDQDVFRRLSDPGAARRAARRCGASTVSPPPTSRASSRACRKTARSSSTTARCRT